MANGYGLGRRAAPDPRDRNYPLRTLLAQLPTARTTRMYRRGPVLDQGANGTCVGHGWKNWLDGAPIMDRFAAPPSAVDLYLAATKLDEFHNGQPDTGLQDGTTVRAGAKALQKSGRIESYHWSVLESDAREFLLGGGGGLVVGCNWYEGMDSPNSDGLVLPSGSIRGGHCFWVDGFSTRTGLYRCDNSWGRDWGLAGHFYLYFEDFARLLAEDGECCAAVERAVRGV